LKHAAGSGNACRKTKEESGGNFRSRHGDDGFAPVRPPRFNPDQPTSDQPTPNQGIPDQITAIHACHCGRTWMAGLPHHTLSGSGFRFPGRLSLPAWKRILALSGRPRWLRQAGENLRAAIAGRARKIQTGTLNFG
jgi:hypothetical protein